jgi:hypothetical protein
MYPEADRATPADAAVPAVPGSSAEQIGTGVLYNRRGWGGVDVPGEKVDTDSLEPYPASLSVEVQMSDYDDSQEPSGVKITINAHGGTGTEAARLAAEAYHELTGLLGSADKPKPPAPDTSHRETDLGRRG